MDYREADFGEAWCQGTPEERITALESEVANFQKGMQKILAAFDQLSR